MPYTNMPPGNRAATYTTSTGAADVDALTAIAHDLNSRSGGVPFSDVASDYIYPTAAPYNAVGDGTTDDTTALQSAINATTSGKTLVIEAGKRFRHTAVLTIGNAGARIIGKGMLLATNPAASAVKINANNVTIQGLILRTTNVAGRLTTPANMKIHLAPGTSGAVIRDVLMDGSASGGIFAETASNYLVEDCTVRFSRADAYHNTKGSHDGTFRRCKAIQPGDDGFAVVSYLSDGVQSYNMTFEACEVHGQTWGRGMTVVGGHDVTFIDFLIADSWGGSIYVASETGDFNTYGVANVTYQHGTILRANRNQVQIDHGSVHVWCAQSGQTITDLIIDDLTIIDTAVGASRDVLLNQTAGTIQRVTLTDFVFVNGPATKLTNTAAASAYNSSGWIYNGTPIAAHTGW